MISEPQSWRCVGAEHTPSCHVSTFLSEDEKIGREERRILECAGTKVRKTLTQYFVWGNPAHRFNTEKEARRYLRGPRAAPEGCRSLEDYFATRNHSRYSRNVR